MIQIFTDENVGKDGLLPITQEDGKNGAIVFISTVSVLLGFGPISGL